METLAVGFGAASRYGSGSTKMMRLLAALQHWLQHIGLYSSLVLQLGVKFIAIHPTSVQHTAIQCYNYSTTVLNNFCSNIDRKVRVPNAVMRCEHQTCTVHKNSKNFKRKDHSQRITHVELNTCSI
jgi:hypothetical protein